MRFDDGTRRRVELGLLLTGCFKLLREPAALHRGLHGRTRRIHLAHQGEAGSPPEKDAVELDLAPEALNEAPGRICRASLITIP